MERIFFVLNLLFVVGNFFTWNSVTDVVGTPIVTSIRCVHQQLGEDYNWGFFKNIHCK